MGRPCVFGILNSKAIAARVEGGLLFIFLFAARIYLLGIEALLPAHSATSTNQRQLLAALRLN